MRRHRMKGDKEMELLIKFVKAVKSGNVSKIKECVKLGVDVNYADGADGCTALIDASKRGKKPEVIKTLLEAGADKNIKDDDEYTALDHAKELNYTKTIKILEEA